MESNQINPIRIVKCKFCEKLIKTRGTYFFKCCGIGQDVNECKVSDGISLNPPINIEKVPKKVLKVVKNG